MVMTVIGFRPVRPILNTASWQRSSYATDSGRSLVPADSLWDFNLVAMGHSRRFGDAQVISVSAPKAAIRREARQVPMVPIVLQKSFYLTDHKFSGP